VPAAWAADALLVLIRWLHALATAAFLGWSLLLLVDGPARDPSAAARRFKGLTEVTLVVFLATGAILTLDRLSRGAGAAYAAVLVAKVLLGVLAYQFAFLWRRHGLRAAGSDGRLVLLFGAGAVLLAAVLKGVFEGGVRGDLIR